MTTHSVREKLKEKTNIRKNRIRQRNIIGNNQELRITTVFY